MYARCFLQCAVADVSEAVEPGSWLKTFCIATWVAGLADTCVFVEIRKKLAAKFGITSACAPAEGGAARPLSWRPAPRPPVSPPRPPPPQSPRTTSR